MPRGEESGAEGGAAPAKRGGGGLTKPLNMSPELAAIIGKEKGEMVSR